MAPFKKSLAFFCVLALAVVACGATVDFGASPFSTSTPRLSDEDRLATMVAQTLQALTQTALSAAPTSTPVPAVTATLANTLSPPILSVSAATDCYAGPSNKYGFVITLRPGTTVTVVGQDTPDNYWIIAVPGYPGTVCWLSGQYASVVGDTGRLPAPATPLASNYTLSEPRDLRVSCTTEQFPSTPPGWPNAPLETTVVFRWTNTDPDQTGVRIYRNGWRIATLGGNARSFTETFHHDWHHEMTYGVQAFNSTQVSSIVSIEVRHCR
jgi:hypothetical protein